MKKEPLIAPAERGSISQGFINPLFYGDQHLLYKLKLHLRLIQRVTIIHVMVNLGEVAI